MRDTDAKEHIVLSTAAFPPVEYFIYIATAKKILLEADENFNKQSYRNRFIINTANGPLSVVIPVKRYHHRKTKIREVGLDYNTEWQRLAWRAIFAAYNNSPFFLFYKDDLMPFFREKWENLFEFNLAILRQIMDMAGLDKPLILAENYQKDYQYAYDMRYVIHPKKPLSLELPPWPQVFEERHGFNGQVSILDLLFNKGPETLIYLKQNSIRDIQS